MVLLLAGASHTGKTLLAQKLLETYHVPYLSIDHLKMGLIRSGQTPLTPEEDDALQEYLWPIVREIVKTAVENRQNLIVEGCYIPFDWQKDFDDRYLKHIHFVCLVMSEEYIERHGEDILRYANAIEQRLDDGEDTLEIARRDNRQNYRQCQRFHCPYIEITDVYRVEADAPLLAAIFQQKSK